MYVISTFLSSVLILLIEKYCNEFILLSLYTESYHCKAMYCVAIFKDLYIRSFILKFFKQSKNNVKFDLTVIWNMG